MVKPFLNFLHHLFSKSKIIVKIFLLIRNQCNCIIAYYLADSPNANKNGESLIISHVAKYCYVIIDVGANKEEWSNLFLKQTVSVEAYLLEPSVSAFIHLTENFGDLRNITLINKAAGDVNESIFFFEEQNLGETSSLLSDVCNNTAKKIATDMVTIDSLKSDFNISYVDFLKIDVEGYDYHVLKGCQQSLSEKKIKFIQFEYNAPWALAGSTLIYALKYLNQYGYIPFIIRNDGLYKFNYQSYGEFYRYSNFFAVEPNSLELIRPLIKGKI